MARDTSHRPLERSSTDGSWRCTTTATLPCCRADHVHLLDAQQRTQWLWPGRPRLLRLLHRAAGLRGSCGRGRLGLLGGSTPTAHALALGLGLRRLLHMASTAAAPALSRCRRLVPCRTSPCSAQLVIILDFIYSVNEWLLERKRCAFTLVSATLLLICGSLVGIGFLYNVRRRGRGGWVGGRETAVAAAGRGHLGLCGCMRTELHARQRRTGLPAQCFGCGLCCTWTACPCGGSRQPCADAPASRARLAWPHTQFYAPRPSCSLNIWFITSILLFFLGYAFISISPLRNESAGLFTSAAVFAYTSACRIGGAATAFCDRATARAAALAAGASSLGCPFSTWLRQPSHLLTRRARPPPPPCPQPTTCGAP